MLKWHGLTNVKTLSQSLEEKIQMPHGIQHRETWLVVDFKLDLGPASTWFEVWLRLAQKDVGTKPIFEGHQNHASVEAMPSVPCGVLTEELLSPFTAALWLSWFHLSMFTYLPDEVPNLYQSPEMLLMFLQLGNNYSTWAAPPFKSVEKKFRIWEQFIELKPG